VIKLLLKNRLFRLAGALAVLYFGLYANKKSPESLGNRLSKEKIEKNVEEVKKKGFYILENLKKAEEINSKQKQEEDVQ
jgi:biotin operon repressor